MKLRDKTREKPSYGLRVCNHLIIDWDLNWYQSQVQSLISNGTRVLNRRLRSLTGRRSRRSSPAVPVRRSSGMVLLR
ncbi:hypothetical protein HanIR_Chr11g0557911 [Helianthus annuus]|nr:hypothetical protein HanIR_Chr11g0557911 [Helianthus annuus]